MYCKSNYRPCHVLRYERSSCIETRCSPSYAVPFPRLPITAPSFVPNRMLSRGNPEKVDEESLPKKAFRYHRQHYRPQFRRRLPKHYSDIVGPSSTKALLCHNDSVLREKHSVSRLPRRHSTKTSNEIFHYLRSPPPKARHLIPSFPIIETPGTSENVLAHRMQAAMSSELMHSLDRNFVFGDRKLSHHHPRMPRSHSFNICTLSNNYNRKASQQSQYQILQRAQRRWQKETVSVSEISPDYAEENQEFILRKKTVNGVPSGNDESTDDCQHPQPTTIHELDEKSSARTDQGVSSLFVIPPTLVTPTSEELSSTSPPPTPPSLPNLNPEQKSSVTFRCRAIADGLSTDHKLISKDSEPVELNQRPGLAAASVPYRLGHTALRCYFAKPSRLLSRSLSSCVSFSQINADDTEMTTICAKASFTDESVHEGASSTSPGTSGAPENDDEHRSSSSKVYHDYKKRTSFVSIPGNTALRSHHSMIIHPMHTRIGLRSSTSTTLSNEKLADMTLTGKQMNVCVINQLNEHLSTRFRQQQQQGQQQQQLQQQACSKTSIDQENYDIPPEYRLEANSILSNVYDEPDELLMASSDPSPTSAPSIPPPPPPLPVGGFRSLKPAPVIHRSSNSPRTTLMTVSRDSNHSDHMPSTRPSTVSSNLSDSRILHELRANPLFTRAKDHLEIEPGSKGRRSGRRLIGSTTNLPTNGVIAKDTVSYLAFDHGLKTSPTSPSKEPIRSRPMETITIQSAELNQILGKRTKSTNDIHQIKTVRSHLSSQCRQSELELIFQKRARRYEQQLT